MTTKINKPEPSGWVFLDQDRHAWGASAEYDMACRSFADRPFATEAEAHNAGAKCPFGFLRVMRWRRGCGVPSPKMTETKS